MRPFFHVAFGLACLSSSSIAHADWQFTKWGMTRAQIVIASKNIATIATKEDSSLAAMCVRNLGEAALSMPYQSGDLEFKAVFMLNKKGTLDAVMLQKLSGSDQDFVEALRAKYGKPMRDEPDESGGIIEWVAGRDHIRYGRFLDDSCVGYSPRTAGEAKGL